MDSALKNTILVHSVSPNTTTTFKFKSCSDGLYFFDATHLLNTNKSKSQINAYSSSYKNVSLLNTVEHNKTFFTKRQIAKADLARRTQQEMGWPRSSVFKRLVTNNFLVNCNFTTDDINNALRIYAPPLSHLLKDA